MTTALEVHAFAAPQGCRGWLLADPASAEALIVDPHLDHVEDVKREVTGRALTLRWALDTHTHADHPSGARLLGEAPAAGDGARVPLGDRSLVLRHAPGHTADHFVLIGEGLLCAGDSLLIGAVARTDYLGGDAGALYDTLRDVLLPLPDDTILLPGHDYSGKLRSTIGEEKANNPWLALPDREAFVTAQEATQPPAVGNMAALLQWNRDGKAIEAYVSAAEVAHVVEAGGAGSIIDVRTPPEVAAAHIPGSKVILLDTLPSRLDEVRATPPPRLILCHVGQRAEMARQYLAREGIAAVQTIVGGIDAYVAAGGRVARGRAPTGSTPPVCAVTPSSP